MREAYCVQLDKIITGDEAWRMIFGGKSTGTKELTFKCPDTKCRATLLASNLRAVSSPSEVYFKTHLKARHVPYCNFTSKGSPMTEITSSDQAKELLFISLGFLYGNFSDRLRKLEEKYISQSKP